MNNRKSLLGCALILALGAGVAAEQRGTIRLVPAPRPAVKFAGAWRPVDAGNGATKVVGAVVDVRQLPVAKVKVQLRDLTTGKVLAETETNDLGEYEFTVGEPGTFVVEMVMENGLVIALSNAGALARYETLQTVVQLPGRWDAVARNVVVANNASEYLGMSSAMTMTQTTIVIATDQAVPPVNPGEPVSPQ